MNPESHPQDTRGSITEYLKRSLPARVGYNAVTLRLSKHLHDSVDTYLNSAGLEDSEGISKILQFGLGLSQEHGIAEMKDEIRRLKQNLTGANAKVGESKLDAYENLMANKGLAAELASLLSENRLLRQRLELHGLSNTQWTREHHRDKMEKAQLFLAKYTFKPKL